MTFGLIRTTLGLGLVEVLRSILLAYMDKKDLLLHLIIQGEGLIPRPCSILLDLCGYLEDKVTTVWEIKAVK